MSDVRVHTQSDESGGHWTEHRAGDTYLYVGHNPRVRPGGYHEVRVGPVASWPPPENPHATLIFPAARDASRSFLATPHNSVRDRLRPAPSEELKTMIRQFHTGTVPHYALLDKLHEEYPEMQSAIDHHTAARNKST
jgi:hypothetical protein